MENIKLEFDCGIPQYSCSSCGKCSSTFGISMTSVKNRGCCWYFPKFTLYEIHKMVKSSEGMKVLEKLLKLPDAKVYNYYIHERGFFDKEGYEHFRESRMSREEKFKRHDETMFFRACPFVKEGIGCTIPARYRSYVCNFFICEEIRDKLKNNYEFHEYEKEMQAYVRWIDWENNSMQMMFEEKGINLIDNFDEVINILKELPLEHYEFEKLKEIDF